MKQIFKVILPVLLIALFSSCGQEVEKLLTKSYDIDKRVVVILPMDGGLDLHWNRVFTLLEHNMDMAFSLQDKTIHLTIEYHNETEEDLKALCESIIEREDVYAVIGGLYSDNAKTMASVLCSSGVTFFTLATTDELIRAYASTKNLWAMTETDITQSEVLLSKVVNYGGESVALIAHENDTYCKTFIDWFAFQAHELGLKVRGVYKYSEDMTQAVRGASESRADYVICVPNQVRDIGEIIDTFNSNPSSPHLLFSDIGYGADVLANLGERAEGIEGVCFGADPESGFDVSYKTFFGEEPTIGAAQLYDAGMLLGYALWYQTLHPGTTLCNSLRKIVDGRDFNMGSWMGEDMGNVVEALGRGKEPYIRGASGSLDFDTKVYTNVLSTVYYNYRVYDGHYIILDYNTADGGNRTDATLGGWNWKATHMQEFGSETSMQYTPLTGNKALLVATSTGWSNYRHQADVLAMYQLLKAHGYDDSDIILILADDLANNSLNPEQGMIRVLPNGDNLYKDVELDYNLNDLSVEDLINILTGCETTTTPNVLNGDEGTNLFVFWSGHGIPGALCWNEISKGITGDQMQMALNQLYEGRKYRKLAMFVEACYSGSMFEGYIGNPGMIFCTAANPIETSKADVFNTNLGVWMSNRFTSTLIENLTKKSVISMNELYKKLFLNTVGSHVMIYNAENFGNLHTSTLDEFINPSK